jgi:hypothetical protein
MHHPTRRLLMQFITGAARAIHQSSEPRPNGAYFNKLAETSLAGWCAVAGEGDPLPICADDPPIGIQLWTCGHTVFRTTSGASRRRLMMWKSYLQPSASICLPSRLGYTRKTSREPASVP